MLQYLPNARNVLLTNVVCYSWTEIVFHAVTTVVFISSFYLYKRSLVMVSFNFTLRLTGLNSAVEIEK